MPYGYEIVNKAEDTGEILIYGLVQDEKWCEEETTAIDFKNQLDVLKDKKIINVLINSGGGSVFAGMAILSMLKRSTANIIGYVDGIAASIASVILQGCKKRIVTSNSFVMIHNPSCVAMGGSDELRKTADLLDVIQKSIVGVYKERSPLQEDTIKNMMAEETWMLGQDAIDKGFADELIEGKDYSAKFEGDKAIINGKEINIGNFKKFPKNEIPKNQENKPLNVEVIPKFIPDYPLNKEEKVYNSRFIY